ncbi:hypothetical protein F5141DRAFT_1066707 [Pisolithus sp. B1]|nr:hypothetical protein F5141DRAFT_1066707 [Pisolithus sp. B1]
MAMKRLVTRPILSISSWIAVCWVGDGRETEKRRGTEGTVAKGLVTQIHVQSTTETCRFRENSYDLLGKGSYYRSGPGLCTTAMHNAGEGSSSHVRRKYYQKVFPNVNRLELWLKWSQSCSREKLFAINDLVLRDFDRRQGPCNTKSALQLVQEDRGNNDGPLPVRLHDNFVAPHGHIYIFMGNMERSSILPTQRAEWSDRHTSRMDTPNPPTGSTTTTTKMIQTSPISPPQISGFLALSGCLLRHHATLLGLQDAFTAFSLLYNYNHPSRVWHRTAYLTSLPGGRDLFTQRDQLVSLTTNQVADQYTNNNRRHLTGQQVQFISGCMVQYDPPDFFWRGLRAKEKAVSATRKNVNHESAYPTIYSLAPGFYDICMRSQRLGQQHIALLVADEDVLRVNLATMHAYPTFRGY